MPLQNRVAPCGDIVAVAARGLFMGNRGILHDDDRRLGRSRWKHKAWIICRLAFRGRRRVPMTPNRYTELFFLDEAVAIAAGHRPCYECRRQAFYDWQAAWRAGTGQGDLPRAPEMDSCLHRERAEPRKRGQRTWTTRLDELPDGAFILADGAPNLLMRGRLYPWAHGGYGPAGPARIAEAVTVLTPPSSVAALRGGYQPVVHPSAIA
jgi:hypothetical protein